LPTLHGFLPSHEPRNNAEQRAAKGFSIRAGEALASQRWLLGGGLGLPVLIMMVTMVNQKING